MNYLRASSLLLLPLAVGFSTAATEVYAGENQILSQQERCLLESLRSASDATTVADIRTRCSSQPGVDVRAAETDPEAIQSTGVVSDSLLLRRLDRERTAIDENFSLLPHKRNYVLPLTHISELNQEPYDIDLGDTSQPGTLQHSEVKFQVSLKFPIASELFLPQDQLALGFTTLSLWQAYNSDLSAPFRETNYEPEIFYSAPLNWQPLNVDSTLFSVGFAHQSNGRGGLLSRSWNRINADFVWEKDNFVFGFRSWWRLSEDERIDHSLAFGDDNPDLEEYLGRFEFNALYRTKSHELGVLLRQSFESGDRNYLQLDWTFPLWGNIRGYAQYVNGYGESLIDYNARIERFGVGILLSDLL